MHHSRIQPGEKRHIRFFIPGTPVQQGSKSLGKNKRTGEAVMYEAAKNLGPWRDKVIYGARAAVGARWLPLDGPLEVDLRFWMPRPASHPATIPTFPTSPPDTDKLMRAIGDALTQARVIVDDARIIDFSGSARYAGPPLHPGATVGVDIHVGMLG